MSKFRKKVSGGFTLLEVLVAVLVLSFGLLGIAGLLLATVQNNTIAAQRSTATFLAQDMADRIRQNINATKPRAPDNTAQAVYYLNSQGSLKNCYAVSAASDCADRQGVAEQDLFSWNEQIAASLPAGEGIVCKDLTPDDGKTFAAPDCDGDEFSPWVIKIFWVVRREDESTRGTVPYVQRFAMMLGGT
jgi:type IV pilus assembly protein PilV